MDPFIVSVVGRPAFRVDLNAVHDGNQIKTLLKHAATPFVLPLHVGQSVIALDEDSNAYDAVIEDIVGSRLILRLQWEPAPAIPSIEHVEGAITRYYADSALTYPRTWGSELIRA